MAYPKRLIEVDLPIARISAHARREKSIRHGHISTLHIWWARRPLAACRAIICAALWPDPADDLCPPKFRADAFRILADLRKRVDQGGTSPDKRDARDTLSRIGEPKDEADMIGLRKALLDFIAEFANWDLSTNALFLDASRALTQSAHESLGGEPGTRPLVVDPFAGGGSIPLEALRVGADAFASDLNPVAVLLNKVVLEYIPKYGQKLADEVRKWGAWVKEQAEKELAEFYPKDPDGSTPIAYLWARTIQCEGPGCGAEVPLMRSLWLAKKAKRSVALKITPNPKEKRVDFEIIKDVKAKGVGEGTVRRGSATCPCCGYTTPVASVRVQMKARKGGARDARLFAVVTTRSNEQGRFYRLPTEVDLEVVRAAEAELEKRKAAWKGELSLVPDELTPRGGGSGAGRAFSQRHYGMEHFGDLFTPRQLLSLTTLGRYVREAGEHLAKEHDAGMAEAVQSCLAIIASRQTDATSSLCRWHVTGEKHTATFGRQAIPMIWDFSEVFVLSNATGGFVGSIDWVAKVCQSVAESSACTGIVTQASATQHPLPDDSASALFTDPPYYDAIPYSDLSDFFYVWMRRTLPESVRRLLVEPLTPKADECIVDEVKGKDKAYFEETMAQAMAEGRRVLHPSGIGVVVFAHKSTAGWEAQLQSMVDAGWTMTGSWPIDTEMGSRLRAMDSAALASSVHLVVRPRENPDGSLRTTEIGDWRDVLAELPKRIHDWMPRLASEGVVGADAIFACLGPALEIFSRYSRVEKSNGDAVPLGEYLEHVWAAVSNEALSMIFKDADAAGLEPDARLTVIWFWVMKATGTRNQTPESGEQSSNTHELQYDDVEDPSDEENDSEGEQPAAAKSSNGYSMEYDAARLLAQGMGVELSTLSGKGGILAIKGRQATLVNVGSRSRSLVGDQKFLFNDMDPPSTKRRTNPDSPSRSAKLRKVDNRIPNLFDPPPGPESDPERPYLPGMEPQKDERPLVARLLDQGSTILDRLHQSMILFGRGHSTLLASFLAESGMARNPLFWKLAQSLSALYPPGSDEKRWVDGVLARKKGLGL